MVLRQPLLLVLLHGVGDGGEGHHGGLLGVPGVHQNLGDEVVRRLFTVIIRVGVTRITRTKVQQFIGSVNPVVELVH